MAPGNSSPHDAIRLVSFGSRHGGSRLRLITWWTFKCENSARLNHRNHPLYAQEIRCVPSDGRRSQEHLEHTSFRARISVIPLSSYRCSSKATIHLPIEADSSWR